jgi:redox-sensitive bicupin YhaK (pirin superfamily)
MTPTYALRPSEERGHADHGWLKATHSFSFANYYDPKHMHFRALRVLNQDKVAPHTGFPTHPHEEMEIVTIVLSGMLEHKDSTGNKGLLGPSDIQVMHAGTGLTHSEKNPGDDWLHLLQIWLIPSTKGVTPSWEQKQFDMTAPHHDVLLCSENATEGSLKLYQDATIRSVGLPQNTPWTYGLTPKRHAWLHMVSGEIRIDDTHTLRNGDSVGISHTDNVQIIATDHARFIWFDLA